MQNKGQQASVELLCKNDFKNIAQESKKDIFHNYLPPQTSYQDALQEIIKEINEIVRIYNDAYDHYILFYKYGGSFMCR